MSGGGTVSSSFYLTLPSNSSLGYFPNNTLGEFTTRLPQHFDLSGSEWEVGLAEIQFPMTWYNVGEDEAELHAWIANNSEGEATGIIDVSPPPGHYESPDVLIKQINKNLAAIDTVDASIRFAYNEISKKISIEFKSKKNNITGQFKIHMSKQLTQLMGFEWMANGELTAWTDRIAADKQLLPPAKEAARASLNNMFVERKPARLLEFIPITKQHVASNVCDLNRGW